MSHRPVAEASTNTAHKIHEREPCPGGIRTRSLSKRAAADLRLRPHGHWDRTTKLLIGFKGIGHIIGKVDLQLYQTTRHKGVLDHDAVQTCINASLERLPPSSSTSAYSKSRSVFYSETSKFSHQPTLSRTQKMTI